MALIFWMIWPKPRFKVGSPEPARVMKSGAGDRVLEIVGQLPDNGIGLVREALPGLMGGGPTSQ